MFSSRCAAATLSRVAPRLECSRPITATVSFELRPTMSMFKSAITSASGTVGWSAKYALPHRPRSSPLTVMNTRERLGRSRAEARSEEHTSELQSRLHLVCRLLLEKKKKKNNKSKQTTTTQASLDI